MRISVLGKGGSGKTSITSYLATYFSEIYGNLLVVDGDVNVHIGKALGFDKKPIGLGDRYSEIFDYLFYNRADENIPTVGTVPPSHDSHFIRINEDDKFLQNYAIKKGSIYLLNIDTYTEDEIGVNCFHGRIHSLELLLHYLLDTKDDLVLIDSTAGIDNVATSMHFSSDLYLFVIEPTLKSINVYKDYKKVISKRIQDGSVHLKVVINKYFDDKDLDFIFQHINEEDVIARFPYTKKIKRLEQNSDMTLSTIVNEYHDEFEKINQHLFSIDKDWDKYLKMLRDTFQKQMNGFTGGYYSGDVNSLISNNFSYSQVL